MKRQLYFQCTIFDGRLFAACGPVYNAAHPRNPHLEGTCGATRPKRYTEVSGSFAYPVGSVTVAVRNALRIGGEGKM
ncbi:hypothetical protein [Alistipes putredinis]|uniref:hypothetical protein n=1 Tax=Alistipes putredinis TaxID=28117 RepID=UPI00396704B1